MREERPAQGLPFISLLCAVFALFQIWANSTEMVPPLVQGGIYTAVLLFLVFVLYPADGGTRTRVPWYDWFLAVLGVLIGLYVIVGQKQFAAAQYAVTLPDLLIAAVAVVIVLEATRRVVGVWMMLAPLLFLIYALVGHYLPEPVGHFSYSAGRILARIYFLEDGLFGITQRVAVTYSFMFILLGTFLIRSGIGQFFNDLAFALSGAAMGGPAKVTVLSSMLIGTVDGNGVSNVATTGPFTIPLMRRVGFSATMAGAVSVAAATGGMLLPPVMVAHSYLLGEALSMPYTQVMRTAMLPALLYFFALFVSVHFFALRHGMAGVPRSQLPPLRAVVRRFYLTAPLVVIITAMFMEIPPYTAAAYGLACTVGLAALDRTNRMGLKEIFYALDAGVRSAISIGVACTVSGIIIGVSMMTGVGQVITTGLLGLAMGELWLALILVGLATLLLTTGLPATAAYIIAITVAGPGLVQLGAPLLAAYFFVFWWSTYSNLTPPVALASYMAASLSDSPMVDVALRGLRLTLPALLVPFLFVYSPALLLGDGLGLYAIVPALRAIGSITALGLALNGYWRGLMGWTERAAYAVGALLLVSADLWISTSGAGLLAAAVGFGLWRGRQTLPSLAKE
jgi:TRAP transporter 4TM/12TM fusion protein